METSVKYFEIGGKHAKEVIAHVKPIVDARGITDVIVATTKGETCTRSRTPRTSHHSQNWETACAYAARVFLFRMCAVKNSMYLCDAFRPLSSMREGSASAKMVSIVLSADAMAGKLSMA